MLHRCAWAGTDPLYVAYHDREWGVPVFEDRLLYEFLVLEGAQAGLSWLTILKKRDRFRVAFDHFDPVKVAAYDARKIQSLLKDPGLVRNRKKIEAAVRNAAAFLEIQEHFGSFSRYLWRFVNDRPLDAGRRTVHEVPAWTPLSKTLSTDLKQRGFRFVGPIICYAFMQAVGLVNDHTVDCFRYRELRAAA